MQREITIEEYQKLNELNLVQRLKEAERQLKNEETKDGDIVLKEMRKKYEY